MTVQSQPSKPCWLKPGGFWFHALPNTSHNHQGEFVKCYGWHCNRCGVSTNMYGHHDCPDRP